VFAFAEGCVSTVRVVFEEPVTSSQILAFQVTARVPLLLTGQPIQIFVPLSLILEGVKVLRVSS
jgi:hypothetical protein